MATDLPQAGMGGLPASQRLEGWIDLCMALGGSPASFTGKLLDLIVKAQATPANMARLRDAFPEYVAAWSFWQAHAPDLTAGQLRLLLGTLGLEPPQ